ncbi:MAG: flagellar basal body-associated FliL family protein [Jannaschia sp.]
MADESEEEQEKKAGLGAKGWIAALILAGLLGGAGFYATYSGTVAGLFVHDDPDHPVGDDLAPRFLELDPMLVSVGGPGSIRQLRFRAFLEVAHDGADHVSDLQPRVLDIFATYLRALDVETLENPAALLRIRAQLLRRVQLLAGAEAISDLLIVDFVIT